MVLVLVEGGGVEDEAAADPARSDGPNRARSTSMPWKISTNSGSSEAYQKTRNCVYRDLKVLRMVRSKMDRRE